ncbi:MAG: hypothetical protein E7070_12615 [Bacteroidales bacterium]|nr:hypothetical protein [Bacteroidales bacterium]
MKKTILTILSLLFLVCYSCKHIEHTPLLYDLIAQYNDSIKLHDVENYYYNVSIDNDTLIMIDGTSFETYWNFLPPPPPPPLPGEEIIVSPKKNDQYVRYVGPFDFGKNTVTLHVYPNISDDFVHYFVGKSGIATDSAHIVNHKTRYNYEPKTLRFKIVDESIMPAE